jgi:hypothetical protein
MKNTNSRSARLAESFAAVLVLLLVLFTSMSGHCQTTTTVTGTIKDLSNATVTSGTLRFTLKPSVDTTISSTSRFVPQAVTCKITVSGIKANDGVSACVVTQNTALTPAGTYYQVDMCPYAACMSKINFFALGTTVDFSTVVPTPATSPVYAVVDLFNNQTIAGNKTFTGSTVFSGSVSGLSGFVDTTTNQTVAGNKTFSGSTVLNGPTAANGAASFTGTVTSKMFNGDTWVSNYATLNAAVSATSASHTVYLDTNATLTTGITLTNVKLRCINGSTITVGANVLAVTLASGGSIEGCKIDGNKSNFATSQPLRVTGATKAYVLNNEIINSANMGIDVVGSTYVWVKNNIVTGATLNGIEARNGAAKVWISGNYVDCQGGTANQSDCIGFYSETAGVGPTSIVISDNQMIAGATDFCVEGGSFGGASVPQYITITGNTCTLGANGHGGYSIGDGTLFASILGNSYAGNTFTNDIAAFEVPGGTSATTDVTVSGNVAECYGPCVSLSQSEQDIIISNNEFRIMANSVKGISISTSTASANANRIAILNNNIQLNATSDGIYAQCNASGGNCADWVIKGNHVNGSNTASNTGIEVVQSAGTMQRIIVQDNSVANLSIGYTWNVPTVSRMISNISTNVTTHMSAVTAPGATFTIDDVGGITFAQLGTFNNGSRAYCSNCTIANPCAAAGTGALAKRLNGVWVCN